MAERKAEQKLEQTDHDEGAVFFAACAVIVWFVPHCIAPVWVQVLTTLICGALALLVFIGGFSNRS